MTETLVRQPSGIPVGGQFASRARPDAEVTLSVPEGISSDDATALTREFLRSVALDIASLDWGPNTPEAIGRAKANAEIAMALICREDDDIHYSGFRARKLFDDETSRPFIKDGRQFPAPAHSLESRREIVRLACDRADKSRWRASQVEGDDAVTFNAAGDTYEAAARKLAEPSLVAAWDRTASESDGSWNMVNVYMNVVLESPL